MIDSYAFLKLTVDSITEHIVVIDQSGLIQFVNRAWMAFGQENNCLVKNNWEGVNYLSVCDVSAAAGDEFGINAAKGIRSLIRDECKQFQMEYPCHSQDTQRWFMMTVCPFSFKKSTFLVISHQDITKRRSAEIEVSMLSLTDGLTRVPNRRCFDQFIDAELQRCTRSRFPISLAMIDVDHFKLLNDRYGHLAGDDCLVKIGAVLNSIGKRPGDLCARYGGEEFAYVFGNTTQEQALIVITKLLESIRDLHIPNEDSSASPYVTVSIGLSTLFPDMNSDKLALIADADQKLYTAKNRGRNCVVF
jgi:diguanylate cyclase (GGDEF)-like protein